MAFSGFIPTVEGWRPSLSDRTTTRVFIAHGRNDPVIEVGFARRAHEPLSGAGVTVDYGESAAGHWIEAPDVRRAQGWLSSVLASATRPEPAPATGRTR